LAWKILQPGVDDFMTISDNDAIQAMRTLTGGGERDVPVVAGESGAAGFAALTVLLQDAESAKAAGLNAASRVLLINTEGAIRP
jgi:diaminopropionate ammonia-lyase